MRVYIRVGLRSSIHHLPPQLPAADCRRRSPGPGGDRSAAYRRLTQLQHRPPEFIHLTLKTRPAGTGAASEGAGGGGGPGAEAQTGCQSGILRGQGREREGVGVTNS